MLLYVLFQSLINKLSNASESSYYLGSILPAYLVMFTMGVLAFRAAGGSLANLKAAMTFRRRARYAMD